MIKNSKKSLLIFFLSYFSFSAYSALIIENYDRDRNSSLRTQNIINHLKTRLTTKKNPCELKPKTHNEIISKLDKISEFNLSAPDLIQLGDLVTTQLIRPSLLSYSNRECFRSEIVDALSLSISETITNHDEKIMFGQLIESSTYASRSKGAPSTIEMGRLPELVRKKVNDAITKLQARNKKIINLGKIYSLPSELSTNNIAAIGSKGYNGIRSPHKNIAGWLPLSIIPHDILTEDIVNTWKKRIRRSPNLTSTVKKRLFSGTLDGRGYLFNKNQSNIYSRVFKEILKEERPTAAQKIATIWSAYNLEYNSNSTYIEFEISHHQVSRLIYNFINNRIYISFHYNWYQGYNPFFQILNRQGY